MASGKEMMAWYYAGKTGFSKHARDILGYFGNPVSDFSVSLDEAYEDSDSIPSIQRRG